MNMSLIEQDAIILVLCDKAFFLNVLHVFIYYMYLLKSKHSTINT